MLRLIITLSACLGLACCTTVPSISDSALTELRNQIQTNQETQEELRGLLDELALAQIEANENIKTELLKTQELVSANLAPGSTPTVQDRSSTPRRNQTKAQWLEEEGKVLVGGIEHFTFSNMDLTFDARIDTGATSSSLDAREITRFERDGERWVRFKLFVDDDHVAEVERPLVRLVRVYQSSGAEEGERRPVVEMAYKFGDIEDTAEFTLTNRSHLEYSVLVGRNIMTDRMIVDVSDSYLFSK